MKKILLTLAAVAAIIAGVAGMSAFEAHVINVTAHIENALRVDAEAIEFGTVFPQEYTERTMAVGLSESFLQQDRINDVEYKIVQKPKPLLKLVGPDNTPAIVETELVALSLAGATSIDVSSVANIVAGDNLAIGYHGASMERGIVSSFTGNTINLASALANNHALGEKVIVVYKDLCKFLSKMPDNSPDNDTGVPSYYHPVGAAGEPAFCSDPQNHVATGILANYDLNDNDGRDLIDIWTIDLKVPPVKGFVGQDWPADCASYVVEKDSEDYGCDLWIEVTGFTKDGQPVPTLTPTPTPTPT
jgi:hypothetical protein